VLFRSDSPPGFDPSAVSDYDIEGFDPDHLGDDGQDYAETEQL